MTTAICCRCKRETRAPVEVRRIKQASDPEVTLYACPDCAPNLNHGPHPHDLTPPTEQ
ncbi:hypothetical protein [Streptomyces litchfieldiae]|uniref:Small CPxCG-related zinc finger protein n=1 Tax=Streptomyces litchfieldiae TaxID=3075543 RepID=A0ABU2MZ07_9ACTN|nr:hypothetical protein [Streptomyces sp. DSM 44938]MDT0346741.1 hypothetical protein [Streptomyces sp. DSM 44938]